MVVIILNVVASMGSPLINKTATVPIVISVPAMVLVRLSNSCKAVSCSSDERFFLG